MLSRRQRPEGRQRKEKASDMSERQEHYDPAEVTEGVRSSQLRQREPQTQWACCVEKCCNCTLIRRTQIGKRSSMVEGSFTRANAPLPLLKMEKRTQAK